MAKPKIDVDADEALVQFLKSSRKGSGVMDRRTPRPEEALLHATGIDTGISTSSQLHQWVARLKTGLQRMARVSPEEARYAELALNLSGQPAGWLRRAQAAADAQGEDRRTIIRRTDAALALLATYIMAAAPPDEAPEETVAIARLRSIIDKREQLRVRAFNAEIRVSADHVRVYETVEIESQEPDTQFYVVAKTLPYKDSEVASTALWGAELLSVEQPNKHWLVELLQFPEPVGAGDLHHFSVVHYARAMAPMWTATSFHDSDELRVRVWYDDKIPRPVWLINNFPPNLLRGDNIEPIIEEHATPLKVDRLGSASFTFENMRRERSYGLAWTSRESHNN